MGGCIISKGYSEVQGEMEAEKLLRQIPPWGEKDWRVEDWMDLSRNS